MGPMSIRPVFLVTKRDGTFVPIVDLQALSKDLRVYKLRMLTSNQLSQQLAGSGGDGNSIQGAWTLVQSALCRAHCMSITQSIWHSGDSPSFCWAGLCWSEPTISQWWRASTDGKRLSLSRLTFTHSLLLGKSVHMLLLWVTHVPSCLYSGADILSRWDPLSQVWDIFSIFLDEGPKCPIGNGQSDAPVALEPPLHVSASGSDSPHVGVCAPGVLTIDSCGSPVAQAET